VSHKVRAIEEITSLAKYEKVDANYVFLISTVGNVA
jgi:hypothetical protein